MSAQHTPRLFWNERCRKWVVETSRGSTEFSYYGDARRERDLQAAIAKATGSEA